jgi:hypothetical protein
MKTKRIVKAQVEPVVSLISINEAAALGIDRIRKPIWATPEDHLKIDIINGKPGPWIHLYAPFNKECNGCDPVNILWIQMDYNEPVYVPYTGPLPDSEEYLAKVATKEIMEKTKAFRKSDEKFD